MSAATDVQTFTGNNRGGAGGGGGGAVESRNKSRLSKTISSVSSLTISLTSTRGNQDLIDTNQEEEKEEGRKVGDDGMAMCGGGR